MSSMEAEELLLEPIIEKADTGTPYISRAVPGTITTLK